VGGAFLNCHVGFFNLPPPIVRRDDDRQRS
jgi:hypothetical protein